MRIYNILLMCSIVLRCAPCSTKCDKMHFEPPSLAAFPGDEKTASVLI